MSEDWEKLERALDSDMRLLESLPDVAPEPTCLAKVRTAVMAEALHLKRRRHRHLRIVTAAGIAAALFATLLVPRWTARAPAPVATDLDVALRQWTSAWDEASSQLASVAQHRWAGSTPELGDPAAELDERLDSLAQSLEYLGEL